MEEPHPPTPLSDLGEGEEGRNTLLPPSLTSERGGRSEKYSPPPLFDLGGGEEGRNTLLPPSVDKEEGEILPAPLPVDGEGLGVGFILTHQSKCRGIRKERE